jgi:D-alanyl-D-alanine carboxypeptidase
MNNGSNRRKRKRYKIRYDRIFAVLLALVVLIVIITSCSKGISGGSDDSSADDTSQSSVIDELTSGNEEQSDDSQEQTTDNEATTGAEGFTFETVDNTQVNNGDLVLVNTLYEYKFQEDDVTLTTVYDHRNDYYGVSDNVLSLDSNVITQINSLMADFYTATSNTDLRVIGGYRTYDVQQDKYNNGKSQFAGGYTDYHTARTFDLGIFPEGTGSNYYTADGTYSWIDENAASYGFILRFPEGKESYTGEDARTYTFRYVGIPHAVYMKENNLCLEEYIELIKSYTSDNPLTVTSGTSEYEVYYVAASSTDTTDVTVPSSLPYTISGNNINGFIVTVTTVK